MRLLWLQILALLLATSLADSQEAAGQPLLNGTSLRVRLLAPLSTKLSRKDDIVSAQVVEPANLQGSILVGDVREVKTGGHLTKRSTLQFQFHTLHTPGETLPVSAVLLEIKNSRLQAGVDEEGSLIERERGGPLRRLSSMGSSVTGTVSGLGSTGGSAKRFNATTTLRLSTHAPHLIFKSGSEFVLRVQGNPSQ